MIKGIQEKLNEYDQKKKEMKVLKILIKNYFRPRIEQALVKENGERLIKILDHVPAELHDDLLKT